MNSRTTRRVAIVHNAYGKVSGEEIAIDNLVTLLEKRGITVHRFSRFSAEIEYTRLGKISAFFSGIHNPFSRKVFGQFLRETRPDVVHIHNLYPLISPSILPECKAQRIPVVMTVHNFRLVCPNGLLMSHGKVCHRCLGGREYWCILRNCENDIFKSTGYALRSAVARLLRRYYDNVDHFICLSEFQKNILVDEGLPANRVSVLANHISFAVEISRQKESGGYVAYVGRISPEKDVLSLIEAARQLDDVEFKFAGDYNRIPEVMKNKPDNCEFLGQLNAEKIAEFYSNARMIVFATRCYEGFPTVLLEAMSHGLPVVCSRIGGLPEIVEDGRTGLLYEPSKTDELADHIRTLWQNPALCQKLGNAGLQKAREDYAADRLMDRLLDIYEKVIKEGERLKAEG
jgi:glycosyltransferase involved in cell wall biosynthesis